MAKFGATLSSSYIGGTSGYIQGPVAQAPEPTVVGALRNLGEASHSLAIASETFIGARNALAEARDRYNTARDIVAKEQEQAGV